MRIALLLVLATLAAGCARPASPPPDAAAPDPGSAALPAALSFAGCSNLAAVFPVPFDAAQAALPDGFAPVVATDAPTRTAVLWVLGVSCEAARVGDADVGAAVFGYAELQVEPPAALADPDAGDHTVPLLFAADPPALGDALAALGLGATGTVERVEVGPADLAYRVALDGRSFELRGALGPAAQTFGASTFRVFGVQEGSVRSVLDGSATGADLRPAAVTLAADGDPLLAQARPASRGGAAVGYDLALVPR